MSRKVLKVFFRTALLAVLGIFSVKALASHLEDPWLMEEVERMYSPGASFVIFPRKSGEPILPSLKYPIEEEVIEEEAVPWEDFIARFRPLRLRHRLYHEARKEVEFQERALTAFENEEVEIAKRLAISVPLALPAATPRPRPPELEIPAWEGKVSIAGRKLIALNIQNKKFTNAPHPLRPRSQPKPTFDLRQELQLRISGNVSDRVMVNVDYDDTKENKRDISIVYKGAPGETVKEISFGDITLNLPQTQFTSYSKQLFGIKGEFDFRRARLMVVGSQTKGQFAIKRFSGQYQFESGDIKDTDYIRRTYYNLAFSQTHLPLKAGSVVVFRDDRNPTNDSNAQETGVEDFAVPSSTYSGKMDVLIAGVDYVVDHQNGILRFTGSQAPNAIIAVNYITASGQQLSSLSGTGKPKIIKTDNDLPIADATNETGYRREAKTFYSFRRNKILRDDGKGSFILKLLENGSRKDVSGTLGIKYPDQIAVDFEQGTFQLAAPIPDAEVYLPTPISKYLFAFEIRFVLKTYILQPNMVLQSEKVYRDGQLMTRDLDYFIDYDSGFLTFLRPELIRPDSQIEVTYEVAPFGSRLTETLIGARGELDLLKNVQLGSFSMSKLSMGSSILLQQAAKPATIPDIRSLPTSYSIYEGDLHMDSLKLPMVPFTSSLHGEIAQSLRSPNTFKKALIESMEGIKIEDNVVLQPLFWFPAANPPGNTPAKLGTVSLSAESERIKAINPGADVGDNDTQEVLRLNYDFSASSAASVQFLFSPIGLDFSNKEFLELALIGDTTSNDGPEISFHLGRVDEDADGDGRLDTEDVNSDGGLNFGEDIGWTYDNPDATTEKIGPQNGRLDSEDLDRNGRLDSEDPLIGGRFGLVAGSTSSVVDFDTWRSTAVSLGVTSSNQSQWVSIKALRVTLKRRPGGKTMGSVRIGRIGVAGSRWERPALVSSSGTVRVGPINNVDDIGYQPLYSAGGETQTVFDELYGGNQSGPGGLAAQTQRRRREQALRISLQNFSPTGGSPGSVNTRLSFVRPVNLQSHKVLAFFFNGPATTLPAGTSFFFQFGSAGDYYEYRVPLGQGNVNRQWYLFKIRLEDRNKDGNVDDVFPENRSELGVGVSVTGNPNLSNVTQMVAGVILPAGAPAINDEVWLNDIFMLEPRDKKGVAKYLSMDFNLPRWMTWGFSYKSYNQDFESPGQAILNQGLSQRTANLNFTRLSFMPLSVSGSREVVLTPSVIQTGSNLVSQLSEGRVEKESVSGSGSLDLPLLPPVSWAASKNRTDNKNIRRIDENETQSGSLSWPAPLGLKFIQSWSNSASRTLSKVFFHKDDRLKGSDDLREITDTVATSMSFGFFNNRVGLSPNYRLSTSNERRDVLNADDTITKQNYPKSRSQNASVTATLRLFPWFEPTASFTSTIQESHRVESASFTLAGVPGQFVRGDLKSINRQSSLSISQNFDFARIVPTWRLFRAFNHYVNFQTTDGDAYENVIRGFKAGDKLWVRKPLEVENPGARRTTLTLRDSISVNSRWTPFIAIWPQNPLATLSIGNNYARSLDRSETTGTERKSLSLSFPDLTVSLSQIERIIRTHGWMSSTSLTTRFSKRLQSNVGIDKRVDINTGGDFHFVAWQRYDFTTSYSETQSRAFNLLTQIKTSDALARTLSLQVGFNWSVWRLTNKFGYADAKAVDSTDRLTQDQKTINPSVGVRGDFSLPAGLGLPFTSKRLTFTNRVILTSDLSLDRKSSLLNVEQTNTETWNWNLNGDFEIGKNLRAGLGSGVSMFKNKVLKDQDFYTYSLNGQVVFQF
ncbi:MAG: hypothetical protein HYT79_00575 [Elusimicrobia bacterium]|nr:hypothetical protein [Elusimicrobiota bacterium]